MNVAITVIRAPRVMGSAGSHGPPASATPCYRKTNWARDIQESPWDVLHTPLQKPHAQQQETQMYQSRVNFPAQHCRSTHFMDLHTSSSDGSWFEKLFHCLWLTEWVVTLSHEKIQHFNQTTSVCPSGPHSLEPCTGIGCPPLCPTHFNYTFLTDLPQGLHPSNSFYLC